MNGRMELILKRGRDMIHFFVLLLFLEGSAFVTIIITITMANPYFLWCNVYQLQHREAFYDPSTRKMDETDWIWFHSNSSHVYLW